LIFAFTSFAQAQEAVELEKTVVTATRAETPIENLPVSVTVITKDDIEKMHAKTVDDVLNKAAGISVRRCKGIADTGHTTIGMRGTGRDTGRTLFLKDGIPLNNTYIGSCGNFWDVLSVDDIEKIEIVRGAASALYGSNAMGGVINIITRPARKKIAGSVSLEGGTFDTYIGNAKFSSATDKYGLRVAAGHKRTDGYEYYEGDKWKDYYETPETKNSNASVGADIWLGESLLKLDYEYFHQDSLARTSSEYDSERDTNKFSVNYNMLSGKTDFNIKSYYFDYDAQTKSRKYNSTTRAYDKFYYDNDIPKDDWGVMLQATRELGNHRLTLGSDIKWGKCDSKYTYATGDRNFSGKQDFYSLFLNDEMLIGDKIVLSAGVRYDHWENHDGDFYDDTTATVRSIKYPDKTDDAWCPRAGIAYKLKEDTKLRASFGTGFKAPSLYYLYKSGPHGSTRFDLANPDLEAEKMPWSYDVGFDMEPNDNLSLTFTWYQSRFKDFLGDKTLDPSQVPSYFTPDPGMSVIQKVNMGRVDIHGVEAGLEYTFNSRWSAFVNHTYNVSKIKEYEEKPEVEGNYLSYSPKHMTKIGFTYDNADLFTLSLYITNVGSRFGDFENTDKKKLEGYQIVDIRVSRELFKGMELFLNLDNVTDEKYQQYYTTYNPPFMAMLGARYTF
jgi:iron complex outermembrane receptor protein